MEFIKNIDFNFFNNLTTPVQITEEDFNYLHIEPLLDEAAGLLDRCIAEKAEYDELADKLFTLRLQIEESERFVKNLEEEDNRRFKLELEIQGLDEKIKILMFNTYQAVTGILKGLYSKNWEDKKSREEFLNQKRVFQEVSVFPVYEEERKTPYLNYDSGKGKKMDKANLLADLAREFSEYELFMQKEGIQQIIRLNNGYQELYKIELEKSKLNNQLLASEKSSKDRTRENISYITGEKKKALEAKESAQNYQYRMNLIQERAQAAFNHAYVRLEKIQMGLDKLYGYKDAKVQLPVRDPDDKNISRQALNDVVIWVRRVANYLATISRKTQNYILPITKIEDAWREGIKKDDPDDSKYKKFEIEVEVDTFKEQTNVRLRGISAVVIPDKSSHLGLWQVKVTPPETGYVRHLKDDIKTPLHSFSQKMIKPCFLGRVSSPESQLQPDVTGISTLFNASPIGTWKISISEKSTTGKSIKDLNGLELHLHLAAIPR